MITVSALHLHPVKGCRALPAAEARLDALGFIGDRRFLVTGPDGRFLSQRSHPAMARIGVRPGEAGWVLSSPGLPDLALPARPPAGAPPMEVSVWSSHGLIADACGAEADAWISRALGDAARLCRVGDAFLRPVKPGKGEPGDVVSFADGYPLLLGSDSSLADLNARISARGGDPVPMDRFRPNLVVRGSPAWDEDRWLLLRIGEVTLRNAGPCARCAVTTTDQASGARKGPEPLATLATFRRGADPAEVNFGINLIHGTKAGIIRVGDPVEILETS